MLSLYVLIYVDMNPTTNDIQDSVATHKYTDVDRNTDPGCFKKFTKVYYLKTHKTGSTTISNILFRLSVSTNSTVLVFTKHTQGSMASQLTPGTIGPILGPNFANPHPNDIKQTSNSRSKVSSKFDIQLEHTQFNEEDVFKVMPEETKLIATVRHPFNHLKSVFNHYHMWRDLGMAPEDEPRAVQLFLHDPYKYQTNSKIFRVRNKMVYEFGINMQQLSDGYYVENYLDYLQKTFDLVLITELLDESLILLKRRMCWEMKDIIYLAQRNASYSGKHANPEDYGELLKTHQNWTWVDYKLYRRFLRTHKENVLALGSDFQQEVTAFKAILPLVRQYCDSFQQKVWDKERYDDDHILKLAQQQLVIKATRFYKAFNVSGTDCLLMRLSHTTMRNIVVSKQYPQSCSNNATFLIKGDPLYCKSNYRDSAFLETFMPLFIARRKHGYLA